MKANIQKVILLSLFFLYSTTSNAQLNVALGVGMGYSAHGDSYEYEDFFKTFQYSGYRLLVADFRVYYNLPTGSAIYSSYRFSPKAIISPYKYSYGSFGVEQNIPNSVFFLTGGYGINRSSDDERRLSKGGLYLVGIGTKSESIRFQFSFIFGEQENQATFLRASEARYNLVMSFNLMNRGI